VPAFERRANAKPNANTADAITIILFPMIDIPPVVWPIEPNNHCEVAQKAGHRALQRRTAPVNVADRATATDRQFRALLFV
jgi:hypothetical protein